MNFKKKIKSIIGVLVTLILLSVLFFGIRAVMIDHIIEDDISDLYHDPAIMNAVKVENTPLIHLSVTCGYATIEWITEFLGDRVSEKELLSLNNGKITTAFPKKFGSELEKQLGRNYSVKSNYHMNDQEILIAMHSSLAKGFPVPISFAAVDDTNRPHYTLHYSVVTGMDMSTDKIYLSNVYGYDEIYSIQEFLHAMKFKNYENMPTFIKLGIFFGIFEKNTIYVIEEISSMMTSIKNQRR